MLIALAVAAALLGYLIGSIPSGMIVARAYGNVDLTRTGSGRTGSTNVLRSLGRRAAAIAFAGDFLKGLIAVALAALLSHGWAWAEFAAAVFAVIGHTYSPFLRFKGGRGVVTAFGATMFVAPVLMLVALAVGVGLIAVTRYVSVGSIVGMAAGGALLIWQAYATQTAALVAWGILVPTFVILAHRDNIQRLVNGTERRLGERAAPHP